MSAVDTFDGRKCTLGEGPLWHPLRNQLFWFDILGKRLLTRDGDNAQDWQFDEHVSAAGWVDHDTLLIASETALFRFDIATGDRSDVVKLEADDPRTRSNDGRADPWGGFWIGTMGKQQEPELGVIYRFYRGQLRKLYAPVSISNAICFSPDKRYAYFTDTPTRKVMRQRLDDDGWPDGAPDLFLDLNPDALNPDGAVIDSDGCMWLAQWGASRVARHGPDGSLMSTIDLPASQITCPSFGGADLSTLFITSAADGVGETDAGRTFCIDLPVKGQEEHQILL
ncbi:SMP-30/gluconolactonase/LRE family protein [Litoreibacter arenae]|uniref:1,4-lactonase n=1 Tax=Litoreibacter arenae DSM 19593 TaxID=1123360 RepID=S9QMY8_9RHOB|nr:SMP-30/gluconolactonase/LRE family protein [Litoreibacter arenae]EPX80983.1 1,4-lactonase [Litoreibacter arenae DSM 19593]